MQDANLTRLELATSKFPSNKAMWSGVALCDPNSTKVYGEPYCGGPTGLWKGTARGGQEWKTGVDNWVTQIVDKKWVTGLWLGDEPEIAGVPYAEMCELSLYLKTALIAAGRSDVFLACAPLLPTLLPLYCVLRLTRLATQTTTALPPALSHRACARAWTTSASTPTAMTRLLKSEQ